MADVDGNPILPGMRVHLCLRALPMGFSWAFFFVQKIHERAAEQAGFDITLRAVGSWPAPEIRDKPIALPYCDNLTVIGKDPSSVRHGLKRIMVEFELLGFSLHEVTDAVQSCKVLG